MAAHFFDSGPLVTLLAGRGLSSHESAELAGTTQRTIVRWRAGQRIRWDTADRVACALGFHPGALWDDWWAS